MAEEVILRLEKICKSYALVQVLHDISIDFYRGEVHCLVGENGAGKSTLIKVISGAEEPDSGVIEISGNRYNVVTPSISRELGVEVIYQEFNLISSLCVAENVFLGKELRRRGMVDFRALEQGSNTLFQRMGVRVNPKALVENLTVAYMQLVEIAKAISKEAKVLIMDEPTAPLTSNEAEVLLDLVRNLKAQGVTILYISHRMNELYEIADRVTVLRDGRKIITAPVEELPRHELIRHMVGRELSEEYPWRDHTPGKVALGVSHITGEGVHDISFQVREGEVLGLAGLVGAGRTEMLRILYGADLLWDGEISVGGTTLDQITPKKAVELGIGLVPEDRKHHGLMLEDTILGNITLPSLRALSRMGIVDARQQSVIAEEQKARLRIKAPSIRQLAKNLSGGNQQKVVLAKWLAKQCKILFLDEPTRGVDVGAKQEIYRIINELAAQGIAIVMVSSEMEELIGMSDRIIVLREGRVTAQLEKQEFSQEAILSYAADVLVDTAGKEGCHELKKA